MRQWHFAEAPEGPREAEAFPVKGEITATAVAWLAARAVIGWDSIRGPRQQRKTPGQQIGAGRDAHELRNLEQEGGAASPPAPHQWGVEQREHHRKERIYWRGVASITAIAAIGACSSAWFAWHAVKVGREQVKISRDTEQRQLRAYLVTDKATVVLINRTLRSIVEIKKHRPDASL